MRITLAFCVLTIFLCGCNPSNDVGGDPSGLPGCPDGKKIFSVPPVDLNHVYGWEPLGHMGPPAHTFPTDHQYLYVRNPDSPGVATVSLPLLAPANIRITGLYKSTTGAVSDYTIFFQPCADVSGRFGHVGSISAKVLAAAGPIDQNCSTYEATPGLSTTQCSSRQFQYDATAGDTIGTAGDGGSFALDWWLQDRRVTPVHFANPVRFSASNSSDGFAEGKTDPASEYFTTGVAEQVAAKIGRYNGKLFRTVAPIGGTIAVDVDSTARGYWFNPNQPYPSEAYHAALAPDYLTPDTTQDFSIGLSQPDGFNLFAGFRLRDTGSVNRPFESVRADGKIYCYETIQNAIVLLRLMDVTTLRLEIRRNANSCAAAEPYQFGTNVFDYKR